MINKTIISRTMNFLPPPPTRFVKPKTRRRVCVIMITLSALCGCSGALSTRTAMLAPSNESARELAAQELLSILPQLLSPTTTTLHIGHENSRYMREVMIRLKNLGYGVRRVNADQGPRFLSLSEKIASQSSTEVFYAYAIYAGNTGLERDYAMNRQTGLIRPVSPVRIIGSEKPVTLNAAAWPKRQDANPQNLNPQNRQNAQTTNVAYVEDRRPIVTARAISPAVAGLASIAQTFNSASTEALPAMHQIQSASVSPSAPASTEKLYIAYPKSVSAATVRFQGASFEWMTLQKSKLNHLVKLYNAETGIFRIKICVREHTTTQAALEKLTSNRVLSVSRFLQDQGVVATVIHTDHCELSGSSNAAMLDNPPVVVELRR